MPETRIYKEEDGPDRVYREKITSDLPPRYHTNYRPNAGFRILYYLLDILEILLAIRFILRLLAANPLSPFVAFIYRITLPFVSPFRGIFAPTVSQGTVVEWATIIAMIVYALIVWAIARLLSIATNSV